MDRVREAANIIASINKYIKGEKELFLLIQEVCSYFDLIKNENLSEADLKFLRYISNQIGIPHYYHMLNKFQTINHDLAEIDLKTFCSLASESLLHTSEEIMIHKYQRDILLRFSKEKLNRFFLSASTSFGKTFLVYEIIRKMQYENIILIFPTIALLSENLEKIYNDTTYSWIKEEYSIHTLSDVEKIDKRNIFIYTPERFLSFTDRWKDFKFDFVFVDEVYKIDNEYVDDDEIRENERDVAYRLAVYHALISEKTDALLAGPFIEFSQQRENNYNPSFDNFLTSYQFDLIDYNEYEIVNKEVLDIKTAKNYKIPDSYKFTFNSNSKIDKYKTIAKSIVEKDDNVIIYCSTRSQTQKYAKAIIEERNFPSIDYSSFSNFINHLETVYNKSREWIVVKALKKGIGIHHGLIPKYVQKEIINLFNKGHLKILISTTTITEGINTTAKNVLVLSNKKGDKELKKFDAKNISGRAGRFLHHYKGLIIILQNDFLKIQEGKGGYIKHKNYDLNSRKEEIDLFYTSEEYLNTKDKNKKKDINLLQIKLGIPNEILSSYKVISKKDKLSLYESILKLSDDEIKEIEGLIRYYHLNKNITYSGFEVIVKVVLPIVKNENLKGLMTRNTNNKNNCILTDLVYSFLKNGFKGNVDYYSQRKTIDEAIQQTSQFVYNTLKYQVVKYWGTFNLMYKYDKAKRHQKSFDEVVGIDALLLKLEYNSSTTMGRLASDYGVPQKIVEYYDMYDLGNDLATKRILSSFDDFEKSEYEKVKRIIE